MKKKRSKGTLRISFMYGVYVALIPLLGVFLSFIFIWLLSWFNLAFLKSHGLLAGDEMNAAYYYRVFRDFPVYMMFFVFCELGLWVVGFGVSYSMAQPFRMIIFSCDQFRKGELLQLPTGFGTNFAGLNKTCNDAMFLLDRWRQDPLALKAHREQTRKYTKIRKNETVEYIGSYKIGIIIKHGLIFLGTSILISLLLSMLAWEVYENSLEITLKLATVNVNAVMTFFNMEREFMTKLFWIIAGIESVSVLLLVNMLHKSIVDAAWGLKKRLSLIDEEQLLLRVQLRETDPFSDVAEAINEVIDDVRNQLCDYDDLEPSSDGTSRVQGRA